jgi:SAM-dependent methyltransferase
MNRNNITEDSSDTTIDFLSAFELLNKKLSELGEHLELVCGGGYALQLYGYRGTVDVDAFYKSNDVIERVIREVGDAFGINTTEEVWLNNSISNLNTEPPKQYTKVIHQFSNLIVRVVELDYLIGMKLTSARERDIKDVGVILLGEGEEHPFGLMEKLKGMGFSIDISLLLEAFGMAYGIDWLETFYHENAKMLSGL